MKGLSLEWFKGYPDDKKETLEQLLRNSSTVLGRLTEILDQWEAELLRQECNVADYDAPNWTYRQAHRNGDRARIRKLRDLLSFIKG